MDWNEIYSSSPRISTANSLYQNVLHGRIRSIKALLGRKLDINAKNDFGENVLIAALRVRDNSKRIRIFQYLLKKGADVHYKDEKNNRSVLSWICVLKCDGELEVFLRDFGAELDLKEKDNDGYTALHHATKVNSCPIVTSLVNLYVRYHVSVDIPDNQGFTPYILARRLGYRDIANVLKDVGKASPAQFDTTKYRSCREWSHYGKRERQKDDRQRQIYQQIQDKINGDFKFVQNGETPKSPQVSGINVGTTSKCSVQSLPMVNTSFDFHPKDDDIGIRKSSMAARSLLELTSYERGHLVRSFRHSEFDKTKGSEYKDVFGDLHTIYDVLSSQKSPSFRKSAIPPPASVPVMKKVHDKSKVSSLAIILGTCKQPKGVEKTAKIRKRGNTPRSRTKLSSTDRSLNYKHDRFNKLKPVSTLPQIDIHNKVV
ncbi:hypothetical protein SNE40_018905 [Patella caerulea]|uniref:Uncharacterized protein n=1 Tax=Patella caerulea TaxID=87958 RepID=A0AAN8PDK6_PATCE